MPENICDVDLGKKNVLTALSKVYFSNKIVQLVIFKWPLINYPRFFSGFIPFDYTLHLFYIFSLLCSDDVNDLIRKLELCLAVVSVLL